jgi:hypothetical protein
MEKHVYAVTTPAKSSRYAPSNDVFPINERILFNDTTTRLKFKTASSTQLAVRFEVCMQAIVSFLQLLYYLAFRLL